MEYLWLCLFGVVVGVLSGMFGIGGGILLVPGLILLFGFTQQEAQGTSLAVLIPPIGLFAALVYYQHNYVRLPVVIWVAAGFAVGAWLGAKFVPHLPIVALRGAFGALLLYLGFSFVFSVRAARPAAALPAGIATIVAFIVASLLRRPFRRIPRGPPPGDDLDYHI